jgi:hypothetical protein
MLSAGVAAVVALVAAPSASALEGIQGRHAIFYPSLELVYQHDDNYYLSPTNEVSADTFIAHANFALEVPGSRQYLRLQYSPQYRNVDVNQGSDPDIDDTSHFFDLQARLKGSSIFSVDIDDSFTLGALEVHDLDDNREFNKAAAETFWSNTLDLGFNWEGSRQGATIGIGRKDSQFDNVDRAPTWFELNEMRLRGEYFYKFTPLTQFKVGMAYRDSSQDFTASYQAVTGVPTLDSSRSEMYFGFDGELGRTTTGRAHMGFVSLDYDGTVGSRDNGDWDGIVLGADVTKSFSRWSKLIFGADRDVNQSAFATSALELNTYYVSNRAAVTFSQQPQGGRVGWSIKGGFQRNTYDTPTDADGTGTALEREDDIAHVRAEVGYHPLEHLSFRLNYRYEERDSNFRSFDYVDNLWIFQVQFGF